MEWKKWDYRTIRLLEHLHATVEALLTGWAETRLPAGADFVEIWHCSSRLSEFPLHLSCYTGLSPVISSILLTLCKRSKPPGRSTYGLALRSINQMLIFWEYSVLIFCACASLAETLPVWPQMVPLPVSTQAPSPSYLFGKMMRCFRL